MNYSFRCVFTIVHFTILISYSCKNYSFKVEDFFSQRVETEIDGHTSGRDEIVERGAKVYSNSQGREKKQKI